MMCLWVRKESDPELDPDSDALVRGTDPGIQIHTKCHGSPTLVFGEAFIPLNEHPAL